MPLLELAEMVLGLLAGGAAVGVLSGLLGIGGGGILVPILFELFRLFGVPEEVRLHLCIGTSLAVIVPTSLRSFVGHLSRGAVDVGVVQSMVLPVVLGVGLGSIISSQIDGSAMTAVWIVFASLFALRFYLGTDRWHIGDRLPGLGFRLPYGVVIGTTSTLMGMGAAAFITTWMSLYRQPITRAIATASAFGIAIAIPGTIGYVWSGWDAHISLPGSVGYVNFIAAAIIIPASVLAAPLGVRLAHGIPKRVLEIAFALLLTTVVVRMSLTLM